MYAKNVLMIPTTTGKILFGLMRIEFRYIRCKTSTAFHKKAVTRTVQYGGEV